jgi:hypothetical protein
MKKLTLLLSALAVACAALAETNTLTVDLAQPGKAISPDLFDVFFEDINYSADGGLYAELVQNRSFEYQITERLDWTPMTAWEPVARDGALGSIKISDAVPAHPTNQHYLVVETHSHGQENLWGFHQSLGQGYFEFSQFCEDIRAKPLSVVPAGVCCQNADNQGGTGQRGLPMSEMPACIQDVLDLITFEKPGLVVPVIEAFAAAKIFPCELPANSLTVFRLKTR